LCPTRAAVDDDLVQLTEPPRLEAPTSAVRASWLAAERADCEERGSSTELLESAEADFGSLVAVRQGTPFWWGVPTTILWYISGEHYLGELVIRHELTPELARSGGHIGYSIAPQWRRQGHGTRMLAAGLAECRRIGLSRVLLTCRFDNEHSRRVILANGGIPDGQADGKDRFWISLGEHRSLGE
jgi:predicted acetyltransferase